MKIIIHWLVSAIAILISAYILPGVSVNGMTTALILAVILGIINAFLRPLFVLLTLPITVFTFGLFVFVINGLLVMLAASIVPGFTVTSLLSGILFAIILAIVSAALHMFEEGADRKIV